MELFLVLLVLFVFIITDARTIKIVAKETFASSNFTYEEIEGNFFTGLTVKGLSYNKKRVFKEATVHWNPITLLNKKITLKEVNIKGVELEHIISMLHDFDTKGSSSSSNLDFSLSLNNIHLDINPYVYEGVKFSSFLLETDRVELSTDFLIESKKIYLYFDSDLVNVELKGKLSKSRLLIDSLNLKKIDSKKITSVVQRLNRVTTKKKKSQKSKELEPFLKTIKIKKILATLKDVNYPPLRIFDTKILIENAEINPFRNYRYRAKKVKLIGETNFGKINYAGYIRNSTIHSKGLLSLSKELFNRYDLPLNYGTLHQLAGTLKLNHYGVWINVKHDSKALLKINSDFNLDVLEAKHKLYYNYFDNNLSIKSHLKGKMPYADVFNITNEVVIDSEHGFGYRGKIDIPKVKGLPSLVSDYFLENLRGDFKGKSDTFEIELESTLLEGKFETKGYESATLELNSKGKNIQLHRLIPSLNSKLKDERVDVQSDTYFDFKRFENSKVHLKAYSNIVDMDANMRLNEPFKILFNLNIPHYTSLASFNKNINFSELKYLKGEVEISPYGYDVKAHNHDLNFRFHYDSLSQSIEEGVFVLQEDKFIFTRSNGKNIELKSEIENLNSLLRMVEKYYKIELPEIRGNVDIKVRHEEDGLTHFSLSSPNINYADKVMLYEVDIKFSIDKNLNIEIEHYRFKIDENEYMSSFYANKKSFLAIKKGLVTIEKLWINDKIVLTGDYDIETSLANIYLKSQQFSYANKDVDLLFDFDLLFKIENEEMDLSGNIDIFGNTINYEMLGSDIVEDADIIIVKDEVEEEVSPLEKLRLYLKINNKKPLRYVSKDIDIEFYNELSVIKNSDSDVMVTGMSTITKGYYQVEDKQFTLNESHIYFAGDPKKPLLDIKANYEKDEYTIHIFISGSTDEPIVNFNSEPYLTQQEILSLILFDGTGSSKGDGAEAYTLLGGMFAKGLIKSLGIDVDHLLLGTDSEDNFSFEIGRKVSENVTVMYLHEDGKDGAKVRIEHNKNFETDIIIQPPSTSSIEFLYKQTR